MQLTKEQIMQGLMNPSSGDYDKPNTGEKVCILWVGETPYELGGYSTLLPEEAQRMASKKIWSQVIK